MLNSSRTPQAPFHSLGLYSIRVTKKVKESLQKYVEECYDDLSINSMLKVHIENLNDGHVRFPKYGMYECPESRKQKMRSSINNKSIKKSASNLSLTGSLPSDPYTRTESDTMGEMEVPADALYGASTQRAVINFPISGETLSPYLIHAYGLIKWAAARVNGELGHV